MVHERPELWDTECPRYSDRYRKKKVWDEVCELLTPDWAILSDRQKKQRGENHLGSEDHVTFCYRFQWCIPQINCSYCEEPLPILTMSSSPLCSTLSIHGLSSSERHPDSVALGKGSISEGSKR